MVQDIRVPSHRRERWERNRLKDEPVPETSFVPRLRDRKTRLLHKPSSIGLEEVADPPFAKVIIIDCSNKQFVRL